MNFVATLEECLRDLAYMARPNNNSSKRLPGVKEASERAIQKLRQLQVGYISAIRKASSATQDTDQDTQTQHPTTSIFQSSDLLHPFLLALNYPNADHKIVEISLRAIRLLMEADAIVPTDSIHILRVYQIQAIVVTTFYNNKLLHQIQNQRSSMPISSLYGSENNDNEDIDQNDVTDTTGQDGIETLEGSDITPSSSIEDSSKPKVSEASKTTSSSSGSWFSWGGSSSTKNPPASSSAPSTALSTRSSFTIKRNAVSSSSGGVGATSLSAQHMEKLALEILSSLVQLMELLRTYHPTVLNSVELWTNATALACLFGFQWYTPYQQYHIGNVSLSTSSAAANAASSSSSSGGGSSRQSTVQQAASSTVSQMMSLLFYCQSDQNCKLTQSTWEDLLLLINSTHSASISIDQNRKPSAALSLSGAFKLCKRKVSLLDDGASNVAEPPSPEFALELMTQIFKESMVGSNSFSPAEPLLMKTMGITLSMIQKLPQKTTVEKSLRLVQWTSAFIQVHASHYKNECRELFVQLIKQIPVATDACRTNPDFEDGYVYSSLNDEFNDKRSGKRKLLGDSLATLFPLSSLWKTGFVLEALYCVLDRGNIEELSILFDEGSIVQSLVESLSDFATIGTSCRDHVLQLVEFCGAQNASSIKPTIFRRAEQSIAMGINFSLSTSASSSEMSNPPKSSSGDKSNRSPPSVLGEILWLSLQGILRINDCFLLQSSESVLDSNFHFREIFPSSLSIMQHLLKRFVGSEEIVQLALRGYSTMADVCLPIEDCAIERKVLLTSLSKLSLPSWGKHDSSAQLQDHHVRSLLCLLRIIHVHYDFVMAEWEVVLWTFEELSVLNVASSRLSDEAYHASLAIAAVYERFASFSTCFSDESVDQIIVALSTICESTMSKRDLVGDSETVLQERTKQSMDTSESEHFTIGEKIVSSAVRAFYGSSSTIDAERTDETPRLERPRNLYYQDYRVDVLNRIAKSKFTLRTNSIGRIPFSLVALMDIAMSNMFRSNECCLAISGQLSKLASVSPIVRPLVMDMVTMLMMSQLSPELQLPVHFVGPGTIIVEDPMHSQLLAVEKASANESVQNHFSQVEVLTPLCYSIKVSERSDVAKSSLDCLTAILEGTGQNLRGEVWSLMIDAIASLSGDQIYGDKRSSADWSGCCLAAFRSLKLIVNDFLGQLPVTSTDSNNEGVAVHVSLLECCCSFVTSRHDVNTSLTAIGLLWTIADQDTDTDSIDRALSKLVSLSSDDRPEVRNAVVNTIFSCIAGRGSTFTPSYWESCMTGKVFRLYDVVNKKLCDDCSPVVDEIIDGQKAARYHVRSHHTRDSTAKLWVATQVIVLQGLVRILRIFFGHLLESDVENECPWFRDAWMKILEFSFDAASQGGGRENVEIRLTGVELLVLSCQLSCRGGIQAGGSPVRVSTNMEVVNGALRTVRDSPPSKTSLERSSSPMVDNLRRVLFLSAFETLEAFKAEVLQVRQVEDDTDLQVLSKFCAFLGRLYDCCRDNEFKPGPESSILCKFDPSSGQQETEISLIGLESRFVQVVVSALDASTTDTKPRYLNQGQRGCYDVLRSMASFGSSVAFEVLVDRAGLSFFIRKDADGDGSAIPDGEIADTTLVNFEASAIVSQEIFQENVSDLCKAFVLYKVVNIFLSAQHSKHRHYKIFIPILQSGVEGAFQLSLKGEQKYFIAVDLVWTRILECVSLMVSPIHLWEDLWKIPRASELPTVVSVFKGHVPQAYAVKLCNVLSDAAIKSYNVARKHSAYAISNPESSFSRKSKRHRDDLLKLFSVCFSSGCELGPEEHCITSVAITAFSLTTSTTLESMDSFCIDAALCICQALDELGNKNSIILSVFPHLCSLILSDNVRLKQAAGKILENADVATTWQESQSRYKEAEKRAADAEKEVIDLKATVNELQQENSQLQKELLLAKESPRRGLW